MELEGRGAGAAPPAAVPYDPNSYLYKNMVEEYVDTLIEEQCEQLYGKLETLEADMWDAGLASVFAWRDEDQTGTLEGLYGKYLVPGSPLSSPLPPTEEQ